MKSFCTLSSCETVYRDKHRFHAIHSKVRLYSRKLGRSIHKKKPASDIDLHVTTKKNLVSLRFLFLYNLVGMACQDLGWCSCFKIKVALRLKHYNMTQKMTSWVAGSHPICFKVSSDMTQLGLGISISELESRLFTYRLLLHRRWSADAHHCILLRGWQMTH